MNLIILNILITINIDNSNHINLLIVLTINIVNVNFE